MRWLGDPPSPSQQESAGYIRGMNNDNLSDFTVTATATYFVQATSRDEAMKIVHEAMLGNDDNDILGWGEVHYKMRVQTGTHYTIHHGDDKETTNA